MARHCQNNVEMTADDNDGPCGAVLVKMDAGDVPTGPVEGWSWRAVDPSSQQVRGRT